MSLPEENLSYLESEEALNSIYDLRHTSKLNRERALIWKCVIQAHLQDLIPANATVLDLGAGDCLVINNINASQKIAVDLGPRTKAAANDDVRVLLTSSTNLSAQADSTVDVVFTSNFFEHLPSKEDLMKTLNETWRVLRPGGSLIVIMPNIRFVGNAYWDYLDHHLALSDRSLAEALMLANFSIKRVTPRFIPYTIVNSRLPRWRPLVRTYLRWPFLWRIFGKQMFVVATRPVTPNNLPTGGDS